MAFVTTHPDELIEGIASSYINNNKGQYELAANPFKDTLYDGIFDWLKSAYTGDAYNAYYNALRGNPYNSIGVGDSLTHKYIDEVKNNYLMSLLSSDNALEISKLISNNRWGSLSPDQQQVLNNYVSENMANTANARQLEARDTSVLSTAEQLQQLGLNMGSVVSLGGASAGVAGAMAQADKSNNAQQMKIAKFNEKAQMTRTLIGLIGGMASAGIYGGAVSAAKTAASKLANEASHYATDTKFAMFDNYERVSYKTKDGGYLAYNHYKW